MSSADRQEKVVCCRRLQDRSLPSRPAAAFMRQLRIYPEPDYVPRVSEFGQTGREGKIEVDQGRPGTGTYGAGLLDFASFLMSCRQNVGPPWESGRDCVISILVGNGEEGMGQNAHVSKHPSVHIAVDSDKKFRILKTFFRNHAFERLGEIESWIVEGGGPNIVHRRIRIADFKGLPGLDRHDIWLEETADVIQHRCSGRNSERILLKP